GVIPSEMPYFYPDEALFAQAIASRTYAYANKLDGQNSSRADLYDVVDTVESQEYLGTFKEKPNTTHAARKTSGLILTYNKVCFPAFFNACSGGITASVFESFPKATCSDGRTPLDAIMISKEDPYCLEGIDALEKRDRYWKHETIIKSSEVKKSIGLWLKKHKKNTRVGYVQDIRIQDPLPGRVSQVEVITNQDGVDFTFTGMQFRNEIIGPRILRSLYWDKNSLAFDNETASYSVITFGLGHGVGLSQVSAYAMAKLHNKTARQILDFFYEKTELHKEW
ncbi:MAG: SpoIID/LytB domain-containing protein, partial [Planctomycetes bacterium]|nr:SpoIID/LytB domain-containing protein [Planctomycetota bacterium]